MNRHKYFILILFVFSFSVPSYAHKINFGLGGHNHSDDCTHGCVAEIESTSGKELSEKEFLALVDAGHHAMEGDETGSKFKRWLKGFDFKNLIVDNYRWVAMNMKNPRTKDYAIDIFGLWLVSHGIETASGPLTVAYGMTHDWHPLLIGAAATVGGIISIPTLDPVCIVLIGSYVKFKAFRKGVGAVRAFVLWPLTKSWSVLGASEILKDFFKANPSAEKLDGLYRMEKDAQGVSTFFFKNKADNTIELEVKKDKVGTYLSAVTIQKTALDESTSAKKLLKEWLSPLGWNARNLIYKVFQLSAEKKDLHENFSKSYVKSVRESNSLGRIELQPYAISIQESNCEQFLTTPSF